MAMKFKNIKSILRGQLRALRYPSISALSDQFLYGHLEILQGYYNLNGRHILRAVLQHGWTEDTALGDVLFYYKARRLPVLVWSLRYQAMQYSRKANHVIGIGSPWAHLVLKEENTLIRSETNFDRKSSRISTILYFPEHSYHGFASNLREDPFVAEIKSIYPNSRIIVSLYWLDFVDVKTRSLYESTCDLVVCPGYSGSVWNHGPDGTSGGRLSYLSEVRAWIKNSDLIISSYVGSPYWYSLSLGRPTLLVEELSGSKRNLLLEKIFRFYNISYEDSSFTERVWVSQKELGFDLVGSITTTKTLRELSFKHSKKRSLR